MKNHAVAVGLVFLATSIAFGQSLGEVARQEAARRKAIKTPGKVYTNDSLRTLGGAVAPSAARPSMEASGSPRAEPDATTASTDLRQGDTPAAPAAPDDEAAWRERLEQARTALSRAQAFRAALQSQINGLNADFAARDNPVERSAIAAERDKAIAELGRVTEEVETAEQSIADIQEEARRAGVPPGWVR